MTPQWFVHAFERAPEPEDGRRGLGALRRAVRSSARSSSGTQEFYDGKADKIAGVVGRRATSSSIKLKKPFPSLISVLAMDWFTATDPATPYSEQEHQRGRRRGPYFIASREVGRNVVLDRNKNYKGKRPRERRPHHRSRSAATRTRASSRSRRARPTIEPGRAAASAAALGDEFGVNKKQFWVKPTSVTSYWALNSLPGLAARRREAPPGGQLGDRPPGTGPHRRQVRRPPHQPDPAAGNARLHRRRTTSTPTRAPNVAKAKAVAGDVSNVPTIRILHRQLASRTSTAARSCGTTSSRSGSRRRPRPSRRRSSSPAPATRRPGTTT